MSWFRGLECSNTKGPMTAWHRAGWGQSPHSRGKALLDLWFLETFTYFAGGGLNPGPYICKATALLLSLWATSESAGVYSYPGNSDAFPWIPPWSEKAPV